MISFVRFSICFAYELKHTDTKLVTWVYIIIVDYVAFTHLRLRLGGSLEDQVVYDVPSLKLPCHPFWKKGDGLFGFSRGCLHLTRWDALNSFFSKTG